MTTETIEQGKEQAQDFARNAESRELELSRIVQSSYNPRKAFDKADLQELADSIAQYGLLEPIIVREKFGDYEIVAGERRWRAAKLAGLATVPVRVIQNLSDRDARILALVENLARKDIDALEEAEGYRALRDLGMQVQEIADKVNRAQGTVSNAMRLLDLPQSIRVMITKGKISPSHGRAIAPFAKYPAIAEVLAKAAEKGMTSKQLENFNPDWTLESDLKKAGMQSLERAYSGFSAEICNGCDDRRKRWCFNPECYAAKKAEAEAERIAATKAAIEAAGEENVIELEPLDWRTYNELQHAKFDCTGCDKIKQGMKSNGTITPVCFEVQCYKAKESEHRAAAKAVEQAEQEAIADRFLAKMSEDGQWGRMSAIAMAPALSSMPSDEVARHAETCAKRLGLVLDIQALGKTLRAMTNTPLTAMLAEIPPILLIPMIAEIRLRRDLTKGYGEPELVQWFLGEDETEETPASAEAVPKNAEQAEDEVQPQAYVNESDSKVYFVYRLPGDELWSLYYTDPYHAEPRISMLATSSSDRAVVQRQLDLAARTHGYFATTMPEIGGTREEEQSVCEEPAAVATEVRPEEAEAAETENGAEAGGSSEFGAVADQDGVVDSETGGADGASEAAIAAPALSKAASRLVHCSLDDVLPKVKACTDLDALTQALDYERTHGTRKTLVAAMERQIKKLAKVTK